MNLETNTNDDTQGVQHVSLISKQEKLWEDTMSMMVWTAPGFQHILYRMLNAQNNTSGEHAAIMSKDVPIAATDGKNLILNPDTFFNFTLPERVFVVGHEIIHNVYGDVELLHRCMKSGYVPMNDGTTRPFNNDTLQRAMDARINALLIESNIGRPPKDGHFDKDVKGSDSVLDIYKKYYKKQEDGECDEEGQGTNPGGFDQIMEPGQATGQTPEPRNEQQWSVEIQTAQTLEQARKQGDMSAALKRMFKDLLEPEVPWLDHIQTLINRACGGGGYDWTRPNDWLGGTDTDDQYFCPADTGHGAGWIVIWGDTSGSRDDTEIASNIAETTGIMEAVNPRRLTLIWHDAGKVKPESVVEITDFTDMKALKPIGGGGTSYQGILDWIAKQGEAPDLFVGHTDGYVDHPKKELPFPVIWASTTDASYPFGQVVRIKKNLARI